MAYSKVILNGTTLMDVTQDTVNASNLLSGETATRKDGVGIVGEASAGTLITKTITENGTYEASDDDADGYSEVTVNVSGGDWLDDYLSGRMTEIIYTGTSQIIGISFSKATLLKFVGTKTTKISPLFQWNTGIQVASFPKLTNFDSNGTFNGCSKITTIDLGPVTWIPNNTFNNCTLLNKLILRRSNGVSPLAGTAVIATGTPFKSGGSGGKIYIPEVMYNHLGDGTSMDYKSASNWSVIDGYGTITWEKLEGSPYESEDWAI